MTESSIESSVINTIIAEGLAEGIEPESLVGTVTASVTFSYKERPKTRLNVVKEFSLTVEVTDKDIQHFFEIFKTYSGKYI